MLTLVLRPAYKIPALLPAEILVKLELKIIKSPLEIRHIRPPSMAL